MDKQKIQNYLQAKQNLDDLQAKINLLIKKKNALEKQLPELREKTTQALTAKELAQEQFCLDECNQQEVEQLQGLYDVAQKAEENAKELLQVVERQQHAVAKELGPIQNRYNTALQALWGAITANQIRELQSVLSEKLILCFAMHRRTGRPMSFADFLFSFLPNPNQAQIDAQNPELERIWTDALNS